MSKRFKSHRDMPPCAISIDDMRHNETGSWRNFKPVLCRDKCTGCLICWKFCPEACIELGEYPLIDYKYCKGCGICAAECKKAAIEMVEE